MKTNEDLIKELSAEDPDLFLEVSQVIEKEVLQELAREAARLEREKVVKDADKKRVQQLIEYFNNETPKKLAEVRA